MIRIALADSYHLHERNFPSLFKYIEKQNLKPSLLIKKDSDAHALINATGDYNNISDIISPFLSRYIRNEAELLSKKSDFELYNMKVHNISAWKMCKSELMAFLLSKENWQDHLETKDDFSIFQKAYSENIEDLALNLALASYWLNNWYDNRKEIFSNHFCCIFSGSMTYTRSLAEILRRSPTRCFALESTFTGNDFIFDELYHPVANNSSVKNKNIRVSRRNALLETENLYDREVIKARNKVMDAKNKNVIQPNDCDIPAFANKASTVLIIGQVLNDFSIIEKGFPYVSTIPAYRELIRQIITETDYNVIFKAHPWEMKKANVRSPQTFDALAKFIESLPTEQQKRIVLVEEANIQRLFEDSDFAVTICSQAGIEAAIYGLRPFILGKSFYSDCGFTSDFSCIEDVVQGLKSQTGILDLQGYQDLNRFLVDFFQYNTVSIFDSGEKAIGKLLQRPSGLTQKMPIKTELELADSATPPTNATKYWNGIIRKKMPLAEGQMTIDKYEGVQVRVIDSIKKLQPGHEYRISAEIVNDGAYEIRSRGARKFALCYHIFDADGNRVEWNGEKTELSTIQGRRFITSFDFKAPSAAGHYIVAPAILLPGHFWLDQNEHWEITVE